MTPALLLIIGACLGAVIALAIRWYVDRIVTERRLKRSNSNGEETQTSRVVSPDFAERTSEQPQIEGARASASSQPTEDDFRLNDGVEELPANVYRQQDDDWLNAPIDEEFSLTNPGKHTPSPLTARGDESSDIPRAEEEWTPPDLENGALSDEIATRPVDSPLLESPVPFDEITTRSAEKSVESPLFESSEPFDEIAVRPVENEVAGNIGLLDEITVTLVETPLFQSPEPFDHISIRAVEEGVAGINALLDEVAVRPVEAPLFESGQLFDEISLSPMETEVTGSNALLDEIYIRPLESPIKIDYELLDDLITKSAVKRAEKEKAARDAVAARDAAVATTKSAVDRVEKTKAARDAVVAHDAAVALTNNAVDQVEKVESVREAFVARPVEQSAEKAESAIPISVDAIAEILGEKKDFKQAAAAPLTTELKGKPALVRAGEETGRRHLHWKVQLPGPLARVLAALRIYNHNEFYVRDTIIPQGDSALLNPQDKVFTTRVLYSAGEVDELTKTGYDLARNSNKIKRGLKKGRVAFLILVEKELASIGWACMTDESKETYIGFPYNGDLDKKACIVGGWQNPKFLGDGISSYAANKRQQLLKEKGFNFERSIVAGTGEKDLSALRAQTRSESTFKWRRYTNVSLLGLLGMEIWREDSLDKTAAQPPYRMITLSVLLLPSPPMTWI